MKILQCIGNSRRSRAQKSTSNTSQSLLSHKKSDVSCARIVFQSQTLYDRTLISTSGNIILQASVLFAFLFESLFGLKENHRTWKIVPKANWIRLKWRVEWDWKRATGQFLSDKVLALFLQHLLVGCFSVKSIHESCWESWPQQRFDHWEQRYELWVQKTRKSDTKMLVQHSHQRHSLVSKPTICLFLMEKSPCNNPANVWNRVLVSLSRFSRVLIRWASFSL